LSLDISPAAAARDFPANPAAAPRDFQPFWERTLDERWHIGFGLRCLIESWPSRQLLDELLARAEEAAVAWGDAVPQAARERIAETCHHRLSAVGLIEPHVPSDGDEEGT
jgi:hypothetical protein